MNLSNRDSASIQHGRNFDVYKDGVLVEHEKKEQMRATWNMMKMEAAYRDSNQSNNVLTVNGGVLMIPYSAKNPGMDRTQNDVNAVLANFFDFSMPLFVWEYPTEK